MTTITTSTATHRTQGKTRFAAFGRDRQCDTCGGFYTPRHRWSRFCSASCRVRAYRRRRAGLAEDDAAHRVAEEHGVTHLAPESGPRYAFSRRKPAGTGQNAQNDPLALPG